jgi:hypothetical protein
MRPEAAQIHAEHAARTANHIDLKVHKPDRWAVISRSRHEIEDKHADTGEITHLACGFAIPSTAVFAYSFKMSERLVGGVE